MHTVNAVISLGIQDVRTGLPLSSIYSPPHAYNLCLRTASGLKLIFESGHWKKTNTMTDAKDDDEIEKYVCYLLHVLSLL